MKGRISLSDFIHQVKKELIEAQGQSGDPFYSLKEVKLEVSFSLNVTGKGSVDLLVVDMSGESKAEQVHKVTLTLEPVVRTPTAGLPDDGCAPTPSDESIDSPQKLTTGGSSAGGLLQDKILYDKDRNPTPL